LLHALLSLEEYAISRCSIMRLLFRPDKRFESPASSLML
jgi:hypothetical protein